MYVFFNQIYTYVHEWLCVCVWWVILDWKEWVHDGISLCCVVDSPRLCSETVQMLTVWIWETVGASFSSFFSFFWGCLLSVFLTGFSSFLLLGWNNLSYETFLWKCDILSFISLCICFQGNTTLKTGSMCFFLHLLHKMYICTACYIRGVHLLPISVTLSHYLNDWKLVFPSSIHLIDCIDPFKSISAFMFVSVMLPMINLLNWFNCFSSFSPSV